MVQLEKVSLGENLAFSPKKQLAILGHALVDNKFFAFTKDIVQEHWFTDPNVGKAFAAKVKWFKQYNRVPSVSEVEDSPAVVAQGPDVRNKIIVQINEALRQTENYNVESIGQELTNWLHSQIFYQAVNKAQKLYNSQNCEGSYTVVEDAIKDIRSTTFGNDQEEDFSNFSMDVERIKEDRVKALTTGLRVLDRLLLPLTPDDPQGMGSLLPGDTTVIMAPLNTGKTTTCINFIKPNIFEQKHVLFLTHEGSPTDIKKKIWLSMLDVDESTYFGMMRTAEGQLRLNQIAAYLNKYLTYIPLNKAGMAVEDVVAVIRRKQEELMAKNKGVGYSLLVDDYPALLTCGQAKGGQLAKRHIDDIVYGNFIQLGLEYKFHVVAAIQVNREGAKINKNMSGDINKPFLTTENVAESFSVMMRATNVITLNRDQEDKARDRMIMYLDKSRSSETGFAVVCNTNFGHAITHSNDLGAVWYRGSTSMSDKIDDFLKQFKNEAIPEHLVF